MTKQDDKKQSADNAEVPAIPWQNARAQPRVRPQWDPVELANKLLDDMERGGRLDRRRQG